MGSQDAQLPQTLESIMGIPCSQPRPDELEDLEDDLRPLGPGTQRGISATLIEEPSSEKGEIDDAEGDEEEPSEKDEPEADDEAEEPPTEAEEPPTEPDLEAELKLHKVTCKTRGVFKRPAAASAGRARGRCQTGEGR